MCTLFRYIFTITLYSISISLTLFTAEKALALPLYTITPIGAPGLGLPVPLDINDSGQVVGASAGNTAFLWQGGTFIDFGPLPIGNEGNLGTPVISIATSINNQGQVVGGSRGAIGVGHAFVWADGVASVLQAVPPTAFGSSAQDINNSGQVLASRNDLGGSVSFLWDDGDITDLPIQGVALNDGEQIAGFARTAAGNRGMMWDSGVLTELGDLQGGIEDTTIFDLNNLGQVVGMANAESGYRAFSWDSGLMRDLGDLPGGLDASAAKGVNDAGQVVGTAETDIGGHAFIWDDTFGMLDLNERLVDPSNWELRSAEAINASGQIVGLGLYNGVEHAFFLDPVDAPPVKASVEIDLDLGFFGSANIGGVSGPAFVTGTTDNGFIPISPLTLNSGDSLELHVTFANNKGLTLTQLADGFPESVATLLFGNSSGVGGIDVDVATTFDVIAGQLDDESFLNSTGSACGGGYCMSGSIETSTSSITDSSVTISGFTQIFSNITLSNNVDFPITFNKLLMSASAGEISIVDLGDVEPPPASDPFSPADTLTLEFPLDRTNTYTVRLTTEAGGKTFCGLSGEVCKVGGEVVDLIDHFHTESEGFYSVDFDGDNAAVIAAADGVIVDIGTAGANEPHVTIYHGGGYFTEYREFTLDLLPSLLGGSANPLSAVGKPILAGQMLGKLTGAEGEHLHFQVKFNPAFENGPTCTADIIDPFCKGNFGEDLSKFSNPGLVGTKILLADHDLVDFYKLSRGADGILDPTRYFPSREIPVLPTSVSNSSEGSAFEFALDLGEDDLGLVTPLFIDPIVAIGYDYRILDDGPLFRTVLLPDIGDGFFDLYLFDLVLNDFALESILTAGITYDFGPGGVSVFRILGIELGAGLDPNDPTAFVTGLTFTESGAQRVSMTAISRAVPEPSPTWIIIVGLGAVVAMRTLGRTSRAQPGAL